MRDDPRFMAGLGWYADAVGDGRGVSIFACWLVIG
jgi:hypothetical protein